jgi:hypothetical protein
MLAARRIPRREIAHNVVLLLRPPWPIWKTASCRGSIDTELPRILGRPPLTGPAAAMIEQQRPQYERGQRDKRAPARETIPRNRGFADLQLDRETGRQLSFGGGEEKFVVGGRLG